MQLSHANLQSDYLSICQDRVKWDKDKDKDLFIGPQEFVVGYSKAPEQLQSSARPICHSHAMTRTGREPATIRIAAQELAALRTAPPETGVLITNYIDLFATIVFGSTNDKTRVDRVVSFYFVAK